MTQIYQATEANGPCASTCTPEPVSYGLEEIIEVKKGNAGTLLYGSFSSISGHYIPMLGFYTRTITRRMLFSPICRPDCFFEQPVVRGNALHGNFAFEFNLTPCGQTAKLDGDVLSGPGSDGKTTRSKWRSVSGVEKEDIYERIVNYDARIFSLPGDRFIKYAVEAPDFLVPDCYFAVTVPRYGRADYHVYLAAKDSTAKPVELDLIDHGWSCHSRGYVPKDGYMFDIVFVSSSGRHEFRARYDSANRMEQAFIDHAFVDCLPPEEIENLFGVIPGVPNRCTPLMTPFELPPCVMACRPVWQPHNYMGMNCNHI